MPTTLDNYTDSELKIRYREPFLSAGLNEKLAVNTPPGVYRGYSLSPDASNNTVLVGADAAGSDHCLVFQTDTGYSITIRKTGGNFTVDLSSLVDGTEREWVLAVFATYAIGSTTAAEIRAYQVSPADEYTSAPEKGQLVVLGSVVIPASSAAPFPADNVTHDRRTDAWEAVAASAVPWSQLLRNTGFEWSQNVSGGTADPDYSTLYWVKTVTSGVGSWLPTTSDPDVGNRAMGLSYTSGSLSTDLIQHVNVPVLVDQKVKVRLSKKNLEIPSGGTAEVFVTFRDTDNTGSTELTLALDLSGVDANYEDIEKVFDVPAGQGVLSRIGVRTTTVTYGGGAGTKLLLDSFQAWLETGDPKAVDLFEEKVTSSAVTDLALVDADDAAFNASHEAAVLSYDGTSNAIRVRGTKDNTDGPDLSVPGVITNIGQGEVANDTESLVARMSGPAQTGAGNLTLIQEFGDPADRITRHYVDGQGVLHITVNASFDGTNWNKDVTGQIATRVLVGATGGSVLSVNVQESTVNMWTSWSDSPLDVSTSGLVVVPEVASQVTPQTQWSDADGRVREFVDANGMLGGYCPTEWWFWARDIGGQITNTLAGGDEILPGSLGSPGVVGDADTASFIEVEGLTTDVFMALLLSVGTTTNERSQAHNDGGGGSTSDGAIVVMEFAALLENAGTGLGYNAYMGFNNNFINQGDTDFTQSTNRYAMFERRDTQANWNATVNAAGTPTVVDTGVTIAANQYYVFRIELHGASTPRGVANSGAAVQLFFIDGVKVAEITDQDISPGTSLARGFRLDTDGITPAAVRTMKVGPVALRLNPFNDVSGSGAGYTLT